MKIRKLVVLLASAIVTVGMGYALPAFADDMSSDDQSMQQSSGDSSDQGAASQDSDSSDQQSGTQDAASGDDDF